MGRPGERYREAVERLGDAILRTPGDLGLDVRAAIEARAAELAGQTPSAATAVPPNLAPYVDKVARHAYKVVDADVERLKGAGYSEDAIFEATLAAALGAARGRLERGLAALERAGE